MSERDLSDLDPKTRAAYRNYLDLMSEYHRAGDQAQIAYSMPFDPVTSDDPPSIAARKKTANDRRDAAVKKAVDVQDKALSAANKALAKVRDVQADAEAEAAKKLRPTSPYTAPSSNQFIVIPDESSPGGTRQIENPNYRPPTPPRPAAVVNSDAGDRFIGVRGEDGQIQWVENPNYRPPREPAGRDPGLAEGTRLENLKKQRDLLGPATVAFQNTLSLIDEVQKMVPHQMSQEKATAYVKSAMDNFQATLRGSTIADEQERMRADRRAKNSLGMTILNQRLSSGSSLAAALMSSAMGSDVMMPPGKSTLGYSPGLAALEMTDYLQGGPQVSDFARGMLQAPNEDWLE